MRQFLVFALLSATAPAIAQPLPQAPGLAARTTAATYVTQATSSDIYERESSQAVLQHAYSPEVRDFAQMMINDHANTSAQLMAAAKAASIGKSGGSLPKHVALLKSLRATPKDRLELAYVDQQITAHEEALALHQGYAAQGDNPGLRAVASEAVPVVERHLAEIRRIQSTLGGPTGDRRR